MQVWLTLDALQCGYRQGGRILAATALLTCKPAGNIRRCGTYIRVRAAIKRVAGER
jgi:isoquinoline 1-oxidoreductase alpha subunit